MTRSAPSATLPSPSLIGPAFPNTTIIICQEGSKDTVEPGQHGEICIVGPQVSRGYKGQPELTAEKFSTITLGGRLQRMYRSGDRGFLDEDGKLNILGRMGNREIKLRGYRMDLSVIEKSILDTSPEVMTASVQIVEDSLVAFVTPRALNCDEIRETLAKDLPAYCIPQKLVALNELPLNANGKVDHRKVLELLDREQAHLPLLPSNETNSQAMANTPSEASMSETETIATLEAIISRLWQEVLGVQQIPSMDTTFYDAGGHSILLTKLHKKIVTAFPDSKISLLDIFHNPTIRRQALHLSTVVEASTVLNEKANVAHSVQSTSSLSDAEDLFAIVGMAGLFPGADSVDEMWELLMEQRDGIQTSHNPVVDKTDFGKDEFFVPRYGSINTDDDFSSEDWAMSKEEAKILDPQVSASDGSSRPSTAINMNPETDSACCCPESSRRCFD